MVEKGLNSYHLGNSKGLKALCQEQNRDKDQICISYHVIEAATKKREKTMTTVETEKIQETERNFLKIKRHIQ